MFPQSVLGGTMSSSLRVVTPILVPEFSMAGILKCAIIYYAYIISRLDALKLQMFSIYY